MRLPPSLPPLGITARILQVTGSTAAVEIEALEVKILREESGSAVAVSRPTVDHALPNTLSKVILTVYLTRKHWAAGQRTPARRREWPPHPRGQGRNRPGRVLVCPIHRPC